MSLSQALNQFAQNLGRYLGKNLGDVSIKIFFCHLIGNLAQLTLFPSGGVFP